MTAEERREQSATVICKVCCNSQGNRIHATREMMFGIRTEFHYAECAACGSVRLIDPPSDLSLYYPERYYSFDGPKPNKDFRNAIVSRVRAKRDRSYVGEGSWVGRILARWYDNPALRATLRLKIDRDSRVLDVGCGSGKLLLRLHDLGFKNLNGVDPYISHDIRYADGRVWVRKGFLEDVRDENWDAIMFHHSLEHVPDPAATLHVATDLLSVGGECLVRLPVVSLAWERYGPSWIGLDPPRHFWLPTDRGMRILARSVGLEVTEATYDSSDIQFWGSELYSRNHAYAEVDTGGLKVRQFFTRKQLAEFRRQAKILNEKGIGDSAAFFMKKTAVGCLPHYDPQPADATRVG